MISVHSETCVGMFWQPSVIQYNMMMAITVDHYSLYNACM